MDGRKEGRKDLRVNVAGGGGGGGGGDLVSGSRVVLERYATSRQRRGGRKVQQ